MPKRKEVFRWAVLIVSKVNKQKPKVSRYKLHPRKDLYTRIFFACPAKSSDRLFSWS